MIGQTISHYRILSKLGEGGMGVVYRAEDLTLGRTVALKFLPPDSIAREEDRARLVHEARAAAALLHPNICPVHEIAEAEGHTFIAMACIEGRSLKDRIAEGPLPLEEALSIARQIGDALAAAHAKGVIHRDIKPGNVMLLPDGRSMLMDFGLAKVSGATKLTRTGTTMGTVAYMSPEQVQGKEADHRSDIWALGTVLYEMVSGRAPFGGEYEAAMLYSILNEDPAQLAVEGSDIPAGLDGVLAKALAKDSARRYQKAGELVADLETLARDREALPAGRAVPAKGLRRLWRRWRPWQRAAAVGAACLVAGAVIYAAVALLSPKVEAIDSIGVLPLRNLTEDASQEQLIDGLVSAISGSLGSISSVQVRAAQTMMQFKGSTLSAEAIGRKVNAKALIEGSCRISGSKVNLSIQLYEAAKDRQLYAHTFTGDMQNLYSILDEMTRGVAAALGVGIRPGSQAALGEQKPVNPAAIEAYLIGMSYCYKYTPASLSKAIEYLEKSIAIDSTFAKAFAGLAEAYNSYQWLGMQPAETIRPLSKKYIDMALSLDPKQPQAIGALGDYKFKYENDVRGAEEEYLRALDLDPNMAGYHNSYAFLLLFKGDCDGAVREAKLAKMLDPANAVWIGGIGAIFHDCFRFDSALVYFNEAVRKDSTEHGSYLYRSSVYATMGLYREALRDVERAVVLGREDIWPLLAAYYVNLGDTARARAGFRRVLELAPKGYYGPSTLAVARYWLGERGRLDSALALEKSPIELAFAYCCLGELDKAFAILEDKYRNRPLDMVKLINDPWFALLTRHQRYNDLLKKAGMKK